jgi:hypothetical protein
MMTEKIFEHTSLLKKIVNPILKVIQFWTKEPYQIISIVKTENGITAFEEYSLKKVLLFKDGVEYAETLLAVFV